MLALGEYLDNKHRLEAIAIANKNKGFIEFQYGEYPTDPGAKKMHDWLNAFIGLMLNKVIEPEDYLLDDWYLELDGNGDIMLYYKVNFNQDIYRYHKPPF